MLKEKIKNYWNNIDWEYTFYCIAAAIVTGFLVFTTMGCRTIPDYRKAMNECSHQMNLEGYEFSKYNTRGDEYWTGKVDGIVTGKQIGRAHV